MHDSLCRRLILSLRAPCQSILDQRNKWGSQVRMNDVIFVSCGRRHGIYVVSSLLYALKVFLASLKGILLTRIREMWDRATCARNHNASLVHPNGTSSFKQDLLLNEVLRLLLRFGGHNFSVSRSVLWVVRSFS